MNVEVKRPNTLMVSVHPDKGDDWYHKCLWARVTFDLDNWAMTAQSDCGDYSYAWCVEKSGRTFLELMCEIEKEYLLHKISSRSYFDAEATKATVKEWVNEDNDLSPAVKERLCHEIDSIEERYSGPDFLRELEDIDEVGKRYDVYECLEYDYPTSAKTFVEIFEKVVQPEIRKHLQETAADAAPREALDLRDLVEDEVEHHGYNQSVIDRALRYIRDDDRLMQLLDNIVAEAISAVNTEEE